MPSEWAEERGNTEIQLVLFLTQVVERDVEFLDVYEDRAFGDPDDLFITYGAQGKKRRVIRQREEKRKTE